MLTWQRIAQFPKKGCCQSSLTQMNANIRWSWPKQISFKYHETETANALQRSFSVNIFRALRLSTVLSPIWKNLYRFCEFCICSLNALVTYFGMRCPSSYSTVHTVHTVLCMCSYHHHDSFAQDNKQKINNLVLIFGANLVHSQCLFVSSRKRPSFRYNSSGRLNYFHKRRASVTYGFFRVPRVSAEEVFHLMFN